MRNDISLEKLDLVPKEKMKAAIDYLLNQRDALIRYLDDPLIPAPPMIAG